MAHRKKEVAATMSTSSKSNKRSRARKRFRLLDLPTELVLRILEQCILGTRSGGPIGVTKAINARGGKAASSELVQPAITRVCHLLRTEGLPLFYKHNVFLIAQPRYQEYGPIARWLECIGPAHALNLQSLFVSQEMRPKSLKERPRLYSC